ncbi:MAG: polysaccharide deacetylase family protein [Ferrovibrio sp.]|uniref:polysaccharide deacetylase family protein n=1 Tax=Ferrovibrio sp. TaxID=1917215 RepID=UPI00260F2155|nr:polysaccharide deacetylase family protein [Ferrovibrio sp.]MCW0234931.1 polysaccharide deacetylase family protein [Ferrovibrio sp.]
MTAYDVLLYHGVYDTGLQTRPRNRSGKHIPSDRFQAEMRHLAANRAVVSMADIADAYAGRKTLPAGAVAVTFDDGFLNNYQSAWPILEEFGVPATIYIATGYIGTGRMIWSDQLETSILDTDQSHLDIAVAGQSFYYPLDSSAGRVAAFLDIKTRCKALPNEDKDRVVRAVTDTLGHGSSGDHPLYAFMNWDQVREMNRSPLISFGAHTIDHISLAKVPLPEMHRQIDESVSHLARMIDEPSPFFSYPEGQAGDYNDSVIAYLKQRGFDHCPTAIEGSNTIEDVGPFHIRRIMVGFEGRPYPFASVEELGYKA